MRYRIICLEEKTALGLRKIVDNSELAIKNALTVVRSPDNKHYLLQDLKIFKERLTFNIDEDGKQSMVTKEIGENAAL